MESLQLPSFGYKIKHSGANVMIFDVLRRKYVLLTPEEWVRQHFVHFLVNTHRYPKSMMSIERGATYNSLQKRTDLCVFDQQGKPYLLVECKAAHISITQEVVRQVSVYNQVLQARYVAITNGLEHYCWEVDFETRQFCPLPGIPAYSTTAH